MGATSTYKSTNGYYTKCTGDNHVWRNKRNGGFCLCGKQKIVIPPGAPENEYIIDYSRILTPDSTGTL